MMVTVRSSKDRYNRPVYTYVDTDEMTDKQYHEFLENEEAIKRHYLLTGGKYNDELMQKRRQLLGVN